MSILRNFSVRRGANTGGLRTLLAVQGIERANALGLAGKRGRALVWRPRGKGGCRYAPAWMLSRAYTPGSLNTWLLIAEGMAALVTLGPALSRTMGDSSSACPGTWPSPGPRRETAPDGGPVTEPRSGEGKGAQRP